MSKRWIFLMIALCLLTPLSITAQDDPAPLSIYTSGMLDTDGTALYSIFLTSAVDDTDLAITSALPEGAAFVEAFWQPEGAVFNGETDGALTWSLPSVAADTLTGPFSFRVKFPDDADMPYHVPAAVTTAAGNRGEAVQLTDQWLTPLSTTGSLTLTPDGTPGMIPVADTGVWLFAPADTVSAETTLTITRLPADGDLLPPDDETIWWCAVYQLEMDSAAELAHPITLALPTRKPTTPLTPISLFIQGDDGSWTAVPSKPAESADGNLPSLPYIGLNGDYAFLDASALLIDQLEVTLAAGLPAPQRITATKPWTDPEPTPIRITPINLSGQINTPGWTDPEPIPRG